MAKAASPVRLQADLMQAASITGKRFHRSTAEQIEYWADIGEKVSDLLDPDTLLAVTSGLARIRVEPVESTPVEPTKVFELLEQEREAGTLPQSVSSQVPRYQASFSHPGYLERIDVEGAITVGQFENGEFRPLQPENKD